MRNILSYQEFAESLGEERIEKILTGIHAGFQDSVKMIDYGNQLGVPVEYEVRSKAGIAHDHIKARLKDLLQEDASIETNKWNGIFALLYEDSFFCRVKKFLKQAEVSVVMTYQQKCFNKQILIPGIPDSPTLITLGYYADKAWTTILGIYASCRTADGLEWFHRLGGEGFTQLSLFPNLPVAPRIITPATGTEEIPKRVKGKRPPKKDTGTDSNINL